MLVPVVTAVAADGRYLLRMGSRPRSRTCSSRACLCFVPGKNVNILSQFAGVVGVSLL